MALIVKSQDLEDIKYSVLELHTCWIYYDSFSFWRWYLQNHVGYKFFNFLWVNNCFTFTGFYPGNLTVKHVKQSSPDSRFEK